jgi:hypothetical protein
VLEHLQGRASFLEEARQVLKERLENTVGELKQGLLDGRFLKQPAALFKLRITLAESAADAVQLELQASGGKAYLTAYGEGFAPALARVGLRADRHAEPGATARRTATPGEAA